MVRFSHLADVHLGAWRDKKLRELNFEAFKKAITLSLEERVDFILISGDFFDTPLIDVDILVNTIDILKIAKSQNVPIFVIGGSHDLNLSGGSHLDVLDSADIFKLVSSEGLIYKNVFIAGLGGKKNSLEKKNYSNLSYDLDRDKINIFMFHINIKDITNIGFDGIELKDLPTGFDYYAGGHIHKNIVYDIKKLSAYQKQNRMGKVVYPGPLFPNNFNELKTENPGFFIVEINDISIGTENEREVKLFRKDLEMYQKEVIEFKFDEMKSFEVYEDLLRIVETRDFYNKIVLLEVRGRVDGKVSDVRINEIVEKIYEKGASIVLRNTRELINKELSSELEVNLSYDEFFQELFDRMRSLLNKKKDLELLNKLLDIDLEKKEDETESNFRERAFKEISEVFNRFNI